MQWTIFIHQPKQQTKPRRNNITVHNSTCTCIYQVLSLWGNQNLKCETKQIFNKKISDWSHMKTNGTYSEHLVIRKDSYNVHKNHKNS